MDCKLQSCILTDSYRRSVCHLSELLLKPSMSDENYVNLTIDNTIGVPIESMHVDFSFHIQISLAELYFGICSLISHILLIVIFVAIGRRCLALKLTQTAEHAYYSTLAFVLFLGEALLQRHSNVLKTTLSHGSMNVLHSVVGLLAFGFGILGVGVKFFQKRRHLLEKRTVKHFRTYHAVFGLLSIITLLCTVCTGLFMYSLSKSSLKLAHRIFGTSSFLLSMSSQMLSYNKGFARRNWSALQIKQFKLITFIATLTTINYEFRRLIFDIMAVIPNGLLNFTG